MSKKQLKPEERKVKISVTISPVIFGKIVKLHTNKSKYVEQLILADLIKNKEIDKNFIL